MKYEVPCYHAPIAPMVERQIVNLGVGGSNPSRSVLRLISLMVKRCTVYAQLGVRFPYGSPYSLSVVETRQSPKL